MTVKQPTEAIDTVKVEIAEMQAQLKRAGEDREHKESQMTVAEQRASQKDRRAYFSTRTLKP